MQTSVALCFHVFPYMTSLLHKKKRKTEQDNSSNNSYDRWQENYYRTNEKTRGRLSVCLSVSVYTQGKSYHPDTELSTTRPTDRGPLTSVITPPRPPHMHKKKAAPRCNSLHKYYTSVNKCGAIGHGRDQSTNNATNNPPLQNTRARGTN